MASLVRGVEDLVVENGEVQGETQTDGVGRRKLSLGNLGGGLVSLERLVGGVLAAVANSELSKVAVVVTLPVTGLAQDARTTCSTVWASRYAHLVVEDLGLAGLGRGNQVRVEDVEDVVADLGELGLDLLAVLLDESDLRRVALRLLLLLDRGDYSPRGTAGANDVLVGDGEKVALLDGEVAVLAGDNLHVVDHLCGERNYISRLRERENAAVSCLPSYRSACSASLAR